MGLEQLQSFQPGKPKIKIKKYYFNFFILVLHTSKVMLNKIPNK
jgi:hypothetical protein